MPAGEPGGTAGGILGGSGSGPISADRVARPPVVVSRVLPVYPALARAQGLEGQVLLEVIVDREGRVENDVRVVRSDPGFDAAALAAVRRWRFVPGHDQDGSPVRVRLRVPIRFQLR
jgi:protein TonB